MPRVRSQRIESNSLAQPTALKSHRRISYLLQGSTPYLFVPSTSSYQALSAAISQNIFRNVQDSLWPTARIDKSNAHGHAQLMPLGYENNSFVPPETKAQLVERMQEEGSKLSDFDADVLDLLFAIWLDQAKTPDDPAVAGIDQLLSVRALQPKRGAGGRRSGYRPEQRGAVCDSVRRLENIWINLSQLEIYEANRNGKRAKKKVVAIESRAIVITARLREINLDGRTAFLEFYFRPGDIFNQFLFGPGRQTAPLFARVIQYDPYRQKYEKRLARYLSWLWRIRAKSATYLSPLTVNTLLNAVGLDASGERPSRFRERLEKAFDVLEHDGVIRAWQYEHWDENIMNQRAWFEVWLNTKIVVEPPDVVKEIYQSIRGPDVPAREQASSPTHLLGDRVRQRRSMLGLSQLTAAEQIGISPNLLCLIEKGNRMPSRTASRKMETWLSD